MKRDEFGLSYSRPGSTYVSPPLEYMHDTLVAQEEKYYNNLDATNNLEIALKNVEVDAADEQLKQQAIAQFNDTITGVAEAGNWENAGLIVRNATKNIATNSGLNAAITRRKDRIAKEMALKELVGKPFEQGGITHSDYMREISNAKKNNGPTTVDENGQWKTTYDVYTPPAYINLGEKSDKFLAEYKPNTLLGNLVKKEDGKWYKVTEYPKTPDNVMWLDRATEMADYTEVYQAAKDHLLQDAHVRDRLGYDLNNQADITYDKLALAGFNREAMIENMIDIGNGDRKDFDKLTNEQLATEYKKAMVIDEAIRGSVNKHAYVKESVDALGRTWASIMSEAATKKAGSEEAKVTYQILEQATSNAYQLDIPENFDMYNNIRTEIQGQLERENKSTISLYDELKKDPLWADYESGKIDEATFAAKVQNTVAYSDFMSSRMRTNMLENELLVNESFFNKALQELGGPDAINAKQAEEYTLLADDTDVMAVVKDIDLIGKGVDLYNVGDEVRVKEKKPFHTGGTVMVDTGKKVKVTKEMYDKAKRYAELYPKAVGTIGNDKFKSDVSAKMKEYYDNTVTNHAYTDLSSDGYGEDSTWKKEVQRSLNNNINSYYLISKNGRKMNFSLNATAAEINPKNITPVGMTNQPIYGHDFGVVVREKMMKEDDDGKMVESGEADQYHILIPTQNADAIRKYAIQRAQTGYAQVKGQDKKGYVMDDATDIANIWSNADIDKQLAVFQAFPSKTDGNGVNSITLPVSIGVKYNANVTKTTLPNGQDSWTVAVVDNKGNAVKSARGAAAATYNNIYEVQWALESLNGTGLAVPTKLLKPVDNNTFQNIKLGGEVTFPYLHKDFVRELSTLDAAFSGMNVAISGLSRNAVTNAEENGVKDSKHLYGLGIDLDLSPELEEKLKADYGLEDGKTKKLPNTSLELLVHNVGSGKHLHVEYDGVPTEIRKYARIKQ